MASFRILGPIEAWNGEHRLPLGGQRQLGLVAFLVLRANRAASSDALLDAIWGTERSGADNRLQMGIARLRKALAPLQVDGEAILRTVGGGYLLSVAPGELDSEVFEASMKRARTALESGRYTLAAEESRAALELWRGPPLAEVAFADFTQGEIRRLEELRLTALETRIDADLELGRHHELVGELDALTVEHPGRERIAGQLMLAEYRCGRQAHALEVYQRTRAHLARELGLEPGPALRSLQAQILEHAPALSGAATRHTDETVGLPVTKPRRVLAPLPPRLAPYGPARFVDRDTERDALERALGESAASGRRAAFVTGEPGIGKTRLVSEVAATAHQRGALVLAGRCDNTLNLPYQPFVEALEHLIENAPEQMLADHVFECGDSVARLVPALATRLGRPPVATHESSESERYVLFRAIEGLLGAACADGPVLLVLEDLHWAELPTLKLLRRLLTSPRSPSLMVLATCRVVDLADDHPLRDLLVDLHREPHMLRMDLRGLQTADVAELLSGISEQPVQAADEPLVRALESGTNGNPFFITELVRGMLQSGALVNADGRWRVTEDADVGGQLPVSIAETFAGRVRRMTGSVQQCLRVAAVLGQEFDLDVLSEVLDDPVAVDALDEAVRDEVLIEMPDEAARFRFSHALMQRYLYRELGAARRGVLHGQIAVVLHRRAQAGRSPAAAVARHLIAAGDSGLPDALTYAARAGDEALQKLAPDEARRWYQVSLELLARLRALEDAQKCGLLVKRGEAERQAGERRFRETLLEAAAIALRIGDESGLVRAALANTRGMQSRTGIVDQERIAMLEAALRSVGPADGAIRARLLAMHAAELMYSGEWQRRVSLSDEALAIARRIDDPDALITVLNMRFVTLLAPETHAERIANTVDAVAVAERLDDPLAQFFAYHWRAYVCIEAGDVTSARSWAARERELADRFRQPTTLWLARADQANLAIVAGELEAAASLAADALETGRQSEPDAVVCFAAQQTAIAFELGRLGELTGLLEQAIKENPGVPGLQATLALALTKAGREEAARELLDEAAATRFESLPYDVTWLAVLCIYAHVSSELGAEQPAAMLYELLAPWQGQIAFPAFGVWGPVSLYLGSLARVLGELDGAERHLLDAAEAARRIGAPIWAARAETELGRLRAGGR
jgi:DNA-binding SARP family transcriptional activator/tetratricopeptide (TPR) repeat protein